MLKLKPSPRYIKHGRLNAGEYRPDLHIFGKTMEERNIKSDDPRTTFYTSEEMEQMRKEIKIAECPICLKEINDDSCRLCENGHKFHNKCSPSQNIEVTKCPICRSEEIMSCNNNYNDIASGIKKSKKKHNMTRRKIFKNRKFLKKTNKKSRRARKSRKSRK